MKKINIKKNEIERFLDGIESDFNKLSSISMGFIEFKKLFCNEIIDFSPSTHIDSYKKIYLNISSSDSKFYSEIRGFIIQVFLKNFSYCPYCGKAPLIHFDKSNKTKRMFQFDHFFPKDDFQRGIINFYNLIPSCNACNHIKSNNFPPDGVFHPYFGWIKKNGDTIDIIEDEFDIVSFCAADINGKKLIFSTEHAKYFNLNEMYHESIRDTANVFDFIRDKEIKIKDELKRFPGRFGNEDQAKRYFFENYYSSDKNEVNHYQNGKLKKDLIDNLKIKLK